jgi:hypothetical protein
MIQIAYPFRRRGFSGFGAFRSEDELAVGSTASSIKE